MIAADKKDKAIKAISHGNSIRCCMNSGTFGSFPTTNFNKNDIINNPIGTDISNQVKYLPSISSNDV
jgi:hypothetical protein